MTRASTTVLLFTVATSLALGCGVSPRRGTYGGYGYAGQGGAGGQQGGGGQGGGAAANVSISDDPREALEQVDQYLQRQSYQRIGPAVRNANLPVNGVIAYGIDVQPGRCYTVVGLAQQSADLNMIVLDPAGRTIGYNVDPDPRPWVTACPGQQGRAIARLQMAGGGGEYYYAVYHGPQNSRPNLAGLFSGSQASGPRTAQLDPQTSQRLQALDQRMAQQRFQRLNQPQGVVYAQREDRNFDLNLEQGFCYAFATLGGPGARDTDVFLVDGSGNEIERDVSTNLDATVQYCPEQSGAYTLRTRMYAGEGPLFTVGYYQARSGGQAQPEPEQVIASSSTQGAGLEENVRLLDADMRARGYEPYAEPSRGQLQQGETQDFDIELEGGKCYAILGVGDNGVRDLDLALLDSSGDRIDRDVETDARPIVRVCAPRTGSYTMQVSMYRGQGNFVYAPYRWPRGTSGPFGLRGLIYVRLAEVTSLLGHEGYEPDVSVEPGQGQLRRQGARRSHEVRLSGGQCYSILVVGGEGMNDLDVTLVDGNTTLATDSSRTAFPSVRHCPQSDGELTLNVQAGAGSGEYFYQVFRRSAQGG